MKLKYLEQLAVSNYFSVLILIGLGCAAYANAVFHPFVHDDFPLVVDNTVLKHWDWSRVFFRQMDFGAAGDLARPYYRPMLDVIHRIVFLKSGLDPASFHVFNIILHIVNALLSFQVLRTVLERFQMERTAAHLTTLAAAVLFVIHPVQVQAVACVSGISNLAVMFFCLLAFRFYLISTEISGLRRWFWTAAMSVMFVFALLCKEQALVFPGLVVWYEWCRMSAQKNGESRWPLIFKISALFAAIIAGYVLWKKLFVGVATFPVDPTAGGMQRILAIPHIFLENLRILFFPNDLHYFRSLDLLEDHRWPTLILAAILACGVYLSRFLRIQDRWLLLWGMGWFAIAQVTTIQILPLFWEYSHMSVAEHFLYFPSIGIFLAVCVGVKELYCRVSQFLQKWIIVACSAAMVLLLACTVLQNDYWKSEMVLFERAVQYEPHLGRLQHILAQVYFHQQRYPESIAADTKSMQIMAVYENVAVGETAKEYYRVIRADTMMSLGLSYRMMQDFSSAAAWMRQAVELEPDNADHRSTLGVIYAEQKDFENAFVHLKKAVELESDRADYLRNFALLLSLQGRADEARAYFKRVLELNPGDAQAQAYWKGSK